MPRRNGNVKPSKRKRIKHTSASPKTRHRLQRTRKIIKDPKTGEPTVAWQPGKFNHGSRRRA